MFASKFRLLDFHVPLNATYNVKESTQNKNIYKKKRFIFGGCIKHITWLYIRHFYSHPWQYQIKIVTF